MIIKIKYILFLFTGFFLFQSCEDYLEKTPYAEVTDEDVFRTYESFQGFIDQLYSELLNPVISGQYGSSFDLGGDIISSVRSGQWGNDGDYWAMLQANRFSLTAIGSKTGNETGFNPNKITGHGIWYAGWRGIRTCNLAFEKLHLLTDATQEEKDLIKGQIYFFRAYFHHTIINLWGGMPYIDKVLEPGGYLKYPRLSYKACADRLVLDLDTASMFLPEDWDQTVVGELRPGANTDRPTKGAAMAYKAKSLLYAGSPLINGIEGNGYSYNKEYMGKAAAAAWEVIKLANKGIFSLTPFDKYRDMFARNDPSFPHTPEIIFQKTPWYRTGPNVYRFDHGRTYHPPSFSGNKICQTPNQVYIDRFEMADGTRYKAEYDNDDSKRWENRDPRFGQNVIVDRERWGYHNNAVFQLYEGGRDKGSKVGMLTSYCIKKYWPKGVNYWDRDGLNDFKFRIPFMRLADVYLFYAEAVNEAYGANGSVQGASFTAVDAVNIVRQRAGMPPVTSAATGYESFRELVWNERCVELCFEGHYWFDIRRWYVGHLPEYKPVVDLQFDKDWTQFERILLKERFFEQKHYWMPILRGQSQLYEDFDQNPGW